VLGAFHICHERIDPEQEALLADSVGLALLVVLENLSPAAERLAFVLHDMFDLPFNERLRCRGCQPDFERRCLAMRDLGITAKRGRCA
jgi:hypothetical protein